MLFLIRKSVIKLQYIRPETVLANFLLLSGMIFDISTPRNQYLHTYTYSPAFGIPECNDHYSYTALDHIYRSIGPKMVTNNIRVTGYHSFTFFTFNASWHSLLVAYRNSERQPYEHVHWPLSIRHPCWVWSNSHAQTRN